MFFKMMMLVRQAKSSEFLPETLFVVTKGRKKTSVGSWIKVRCALCEYDQCLHNTKSYLYKIVFKPLAGECNALSQC